MSHKLFFILDWMILLAILGCALGSTGNPQEVEASGQPDVLPDDFQPAIATIEPAIYTALDRKGTTQVLVILQQQADLSGASVLQSKTEKGTFVYEQLTKIASQTQAPLRQFLDSMGAKYRTYWITNLLMVTVDAGLLDKLSHQPGIARIESYTPPVVESIGHNLGPMYGSEFGPPVPAMISNESDRSLEERGAGAISSSPATVEWNIQRVGADDVWAMGYTGQGVVVGSLDSGVDWTHLALVNHYRLWIPGAPNRHDYNWFDGTGGSLVPLDYSWHGTVTMGPIVGDDGGSNQIGMAPGASWIACPGTNSPHVGILDCLQWFLAPTKLDGTDPRPDLAPDIINNSWGSATNFHAAFQALYAAGIYSSNFAGNGGSGCSTIVNPSQWPEVTTAGAFGQGDIIGDFSSRGPVSIDHEISVKPDIAAPGVNIRSSLPGGGYYSDCTGTSMAAPHVAGGVALLISAVPELRGRVDLINMLLKTNAEPKASAECLPGGGVPNNVWGWGILNVYNAVLAAQSLELGAIEGQVVEAASQEPLAGVKLTFRDTTLDWTYPDQSNNLGYYIHTLPEGTYDITASRYGYLDSTVSGVEISSGITITQDLELQQAPMWNISGVITDSQSGEPLSASVTVVGTTVSTVTDPVTGVYSGNISQGDWWLVVKSPGYATEAIFVEIDQNWVLNFGLEPTTNYTMRRSVDGGCGIPFEWLDARTGSSWNLEDDDFISLAIPNSRTFMFYGNSYNQVFIGSNGVLTFGSGSKNWSASIPDPVQPNNGIYAFSTDLNPWGGSQGRIYTKYINDRYFVIEWYQVQHFPDGNPETFEIILDLDTNVVKIQYLIVSDPSDVIVGVENDNGTEATLYAYNNPDLVFNNAAMEFYPWIGTPPPTGGEGDLTGEVTNAMTHLPVEGAVISATAFQTGNVYTSTTNSSGSYSASLCADWYDVMAAAPEYIASIEVHTSIYPNEQTIQDFTLTPVVSPPISATLAGPTDGWVGASSTFTVTVEPISTTLPLEYIWVADGQEPVTHTAGLTDTISFIWETPGTYAVSVTASNMAGTVYATRNITISTPMSRSYLPLIIKSEDLSTSSGARLSDYGYWIGVR